MNLGFRIIEIKETWLALGVACFGLVLSSACLSASPEPEPAYAGKPLTAWLDSLRLAKTTNEFLRASNAVHRIGSNAVPYLLRIVRARDGELPQPPSPPEPAYHYFLKPLCQRDELEVRVALACRVLGSAAKPVMTELSTAFATATNDIGVARAGAGLIDLGPIGFGPILDSLYPRSFGAGKGYIVEGMYTVTEQEPAGALSELIGVVKRVPLPDYNTNSFARAILRQVLEEYLPTDPESVASLVPTLRLSLADADPRVRPFVLLYLRRCGQNANVLAPDLLPLLHDPIETTRSAATNALLAIDSAAAAKAGVR